MNSVQAICKLGQVYCVFFCSKEKYMLLMIRFLAIFHQAELVKNFTIFNIFGLLASDL